MTEWEGQMVKKPSVCDIIGVKYFPVLLNLFQSISFYHLTAALSLPSFCCPYF